MTIADSDIVTLRMAGAGIGLAADVAGPEAGVPVILSHGGGQTRASWGGASRALAARGFRVVSLDLRGHGESDWSPDSVYGLDLFAEDLAAVVRQMTAKPFLVGASLGGIASLLVAGEARAAVAGLVLVDVAPRLEPVGTQKITGFMTANPDGFASVEDAADAVSAYLPHRPRPKDVSGLRKNLRLRADGRWLWHWDPGFLQDRDLDPARGSERLMAAARALTMPAMLIRGGRSDVVSPEGAREFLELAPHAEFVDVAGADHMVAGDRNDAFNQAVIDFVSRHGG